MKLIAKEHCYLEGPKGANGKATQILVPVGDSFTTNAEVGAILIARGKAITADGDAGGKSDKR